MSEISFAIANRQVATVRIDPNSVQGRDTGGLPQLYLPLKLQLLPAGQSGDIQYTIVRLAGTLHSQQIGEFATFEVAPLAALPNPTPYERQQDANVPFDRLRIRRLRDARAGNDAHFHITLLISAYAIFEYIATKN